MTGLQKQADAAARLWGATSKPTLLSHRENAIFAIHIGDKKAALRLHRPGYRMPAEILSELQWCSTLVTAGMDVPYGIPATDGDLLHGLPDGPNVTVTSWVNGEPVGSSATPPGDDAVELYFNLGRLLGTLHALSDSWTKPYGFIRPAWNQAALTGPDPAWGPYWSHSALTRPERALIAKARDKAHAVLEKTSLDQGLIHADALRENIFRTPNGLTLIDFDDGGIGYRHYELGCALIQSFSDLRLPELAQALWTGYTEKRALSHPELLAMFVMLRAFSSLGWIATRTGPDDPQHAIYVRRALAAAESFLNGPALFQVV